MNKSEKMMDRDGPRRNKHQAPPDDEQRDVVLKSPFPLRLIFNGAGMLAAFFASFFVWSWAAPISSAVIAPGVVGVDTYRKKIQHLEGGIIDTILVRDGDKVQRGDVLVKLRDLAPSTSVNRLKAEYYETLSIITRLEAERDEAENFKAVKPQQDDPDSASIRAANKVQTRVFASRRTLYIESLSIIRQKIAQSEEEIIGLEGQLASAIKQGQLFDEELADAAKLYKLKLLRKKQFLALRRQRTQLDGSQSKYRGSIARTQQKILELKLTLSEMRAAKISVAVEQLRKQKALAYSLSQRLIAGKDVLERTQILSPIDGIVVNLLVHSKGGVIKAGQPLMEVVPSSDKLVVDARIKPEDIDEISAGMEANVQLTSLSRRDRRPIKAVLASVSADRLIEPGTGRPFYLARVLLDPAAVKKRNVALLAGMGADVFIRTGTRTPLEYLFDPVVRTFQRGMREQ